MAVPIYLIIEKTTNIYDEEDRKYHGICHGYNNAYAYIENLFKENNIYKTDITKSYSLEGVEIYAKSRGGYHSYIIHKVEVLEPLG